MSDGQKPVSSENNYSIGDEKKQGQLTELVMNVSETEC